MDITMNELLDDIFGTTTEEHLYEENTNIKRTLNTKYLKFVGNMYSATFLAECEQELQKFGQTFVFRQWQAELLIKYSPAKNFKRKRNLGYIVY